jgi:hypothetical protein
VVAVRQEIQKSSQFAVVEQTQRTAELDLVVPFTTPELTRVALKAAERMGEGLHTALRLIKVQVVPYPLDLEQSPVPIDFLKEQLEQFETGLPTTREVRLARELKPGLLDALRRDSVVILATRWRPWSTHTERLAGWLRRAGFKVLLISGEAKDA